MRSATALVAIALVVSAGCLKGNEAPPAPAEAGAPGNATVEITDRPDTSFGEVATGPAAGPDEAATLDRAPELRVGEWWKIRFESPLTGESREFVRVVAAKSEDGYVVGMPHEGWYKEAVVYHAPGFGDVNADLSYLTHDAPFAPVKFPLRDGDTWETSFSGAGPLTASVKTDPGAQTATVTFTAPGGAGPFGLLAAAGQGGAPRKVMELVYDAKRHEVVKFDDSTVRYEVIEHGYDYAGWVTVPRGEDLVFFNGRFFGALDLDLQPALPMETVGLDGGFNRVSFILATQAIGGTAGAYRERALAPDGAAYEHQAIPGSGFSMTFFEATNPDGDWQLEHVVAGPGGGFVEGIAYHQYDIRLPDGLKRSDHSHSVVR